MSASEGEARTSPSVSCVSAFGVFEGSRLGSTKGAGRGAYTRSYSIHSTVWSGRLMWLPGGFYAARPPVYLPQGHHRAFL